MLLIPFVPSCPSLIIFFFNFFFYSNIGEALLCKGYVTVVRYRQDDDQRASDYDLLLAAEAKAVKESKGVYSKKEAKTQTVVDITGVRKKTFSRIGSSHTFTTNYLRMCIYSI